MINKIARGRNKYSFAPVMSDEEASDLHLQLQQIEQNNYQTLVQTQGGNFYNDYAGENSFQMQLIYWDLKTHQQDLSQAFSNPALANQVLTKLDHIIQEVSKCDTVKLINSAHLFMQYFATDTKDFHRDHAIANYPQQLRLSITFSGNGTLFRTWENQNQEPVEHIEETPLGHVACFDRAEAEHARPQPNGKNRINTLIDITIKPPPKTLKLFCTINGRNYFGAACEDKEKASNTYQPLKPS